MSEEYMIRLQEEREAREDVDTDTLELESKEKRAEEIKLEEDREEFGEGDM